jgi:hypothetical protein
MKTESGRGFIALRRASGGAARAALAPVPPPDGAPYRTSRCAAKTSARDPRAERRPEDLGSSQPPTGSPSHRDAAPEDDGAAGVADERRPGNVLALCYFKARILQLTYPRPPYTLQVRTTPFAS